MAHGLSSQRHSPTDLTSVFLFFFNTWRQAVPKGTSRHVLKKGPFYLIYNRKVAQQEDETPSRSKKQDPTS
jgi:hypothetical protein